MGPDLYPAVSQLSALYLCCDTFGFFLPGPRRCSCWRSFRKPECLKMYGAPSTKIQSQIMVDCTGMLISILPYVVIFSVRNRECFSAIKSEINIFLTGFPQLGNFGRNCRIIILKRNPGFYMELVEMFRQTSFCMKNILKWYGRFLNIQLKNDWFS